jgi:sensor histidine kinase YesM
LDKLTETKFNTPEGVWRFSKFSSKDHEHKIYLSVGESGYFLKLVRNEFYYFNYLAYPAIYILFLIFILIIRRINTYQVVQKESLKQRLILLQLQGIKAQLDPHFTFNTLNSVASLIYLEDRQSAYDYMNKFTQLLRGTLNDAERIYRSVAEELSFVTTYLDLEKLRFGDKFNFEIEVGEGVSQKEQVPKLVLQTFAENSIKHGIMPCAEGGIIKIRVMRENDYLRLSVEDNGVGRSRAAGQSTSTGKGLKITWEFYDILNQINKKPVLHSITDLFDDAGHAVGTLVDIWVPMELSSRYNAQS